MVADRSLSPPSAGAAGAVQRKAGPAVDAELDVAFLQHATSNFISLFSPDVAALGMGT